jgi:Fur family ferric uptake transcriptional regulator
LRFLKSGVFWGLESWSDSFWKVIAMSESTVLVEEVKQSIREAGLRATPARIATLVMLRNASSPLTHAYVAQQLAPTGVDKATAFRNLNDMTDVGLVRKSELGDHVWRFEATSDSRHADDNHPHFLCLDCGNVSCLDDVKLTAGSLRVSEKVGEVSEILLRGRCNDCR